VDFNENALQGLDHAKEQRLHNAGNQLLGGPQGIGGDCQHVGGLSFHQLPHTVVDHKHRIGDIDAEGLGVAEGGEIRDEEPVRVRGNQLLRANAEEREGLGHKPGRRLYQVVIKRGHLQLAGKDPQDVSGRIL